MRGQSPSLEREISASEAKASQGNETVIETLSNFGNVSSVRGSETILVDATESENKMQVWTQRMADNTNRKMAELRKQMNEKTIKDNERSEEQQKNAISS